MAPPASPAWISRPMLVKVSSRRLPEPEPEPDDCILICNTRLESCGVPMAVAGCENRVARRPVLGVQGHMREAAVLIVTGRAETAPKLRVMPFKAARELGAGIFARFARGLAWV